jgi:hypothetical protein
MTRKGILYYGGLRLFDGTDNEILEKIGYLERTGCKALD